MYKPEIIAGLKNTMDRGYTLEQSIQSFINAGYPRDDVLDSADRLRKEPQLGMQVTAPTRGEELKPLPPSGKKVGFLHKIHLPHIHLKPYYEQQQGIPLKQVQPAVQKQERVIPLMETSSAGVEKMKPEERARIERLEIDLRKKPGKQKTETKLGREVPATAILELPHYAPKKIKLDKRDISLGKVKTLNIKRDVQPHRETTQVLGLPRNPRRKSDNAIFIILGILLFILLGALLYSYFYREKLLQIIEHMLRDS